MMRRPADTSTEWIGRLYDRHAAALYRYAVIVLADPAAAFDVVQQVFLSVLRQRPVDDIEDAEHYLRRAVRNECYSLLRRPERSRPAPPSPLLEPVAPEDDPVARVAIEQVLRRLPPEQREVVQLKVFEGRTFREIAALTGESINTVASRYRYAIEKLRAQLGARR
jgi:RNA polymerase sigma-70 factor (ECF subfamily)